MKQTSLIFLLLIAANLVSCKQDPYPATGEIKVTQRQEQRTVEPPLAMSVDDVIEYKEGRYKEYQVRVSVKDPGKPMVKIDNLPAGAVYDEANFTLKWRPGFFDGNDSTDPSIKSKIYPVTIWLRNSLDPIRALKKVVNLVVYDTPQLIEVNPETIYSIDEGRKYSNKFTVNNADFPKGPYRIVTTGFPANTEVVKVDENTFRLEFTPDRDYRMV